MIDKPFTWQWWDIIRAHLDQDIKALETELARKKEMRDYAEQREELGRRNAIDKRYKVAS